MKGRWSYPLRFKSTMAGKLSRLLNLPVMYLDEVFWQPGWVLSDGSKIQNRVIEFMAHSEKTVGGWVIDGNWTQKLGSTVQDAATDVICSSSLSFLLPNSCSSRARSAVVTLLSSAPAADIWATPWVHPAMRTWVRREPKGSLLLARQHHLVLPVEPLEDPAKTAGAI